MKFLYGLCVLMACLATAFSNFFSPEILNRAGLAERVVCFDEVIDGNQPYLRCQNDAVLRIRSASQEFSTINSCPLQYTPGRLPQECAPGEPFVGQNVTLNLKNACDGQAECTFTFEIFPDLQCLNLATNAITTPEQIMTQLRVKYECVMPRPHWRPFSNKRFNSKFSPSLFRPQRRISYNRMMQL